jgi:hypothetical protein
MRSKNKMLKDLNILYQQALAQDNVTVALKIIELKAKIQGLLTPPKSKNFSIQQLSDTELEEIIKELQTE